MIMCKESSDGETGDFEVGGTFNYAQLLLGNSSPDIVSS